uniref:ATP-dependent RNA helicase n=1 Tax=Ciona savignyi TaxID=51511 RepID=H2YIC2_CIOSA
ENLGVMPEIGKEIVAIGWQLPTDIQAESIPLILGGGDVLMAAETGSGKTAAFSIPVIQVVHETLLEIRSGGSFNHYTHQVDGAIKQPRTWKMNPFDRGNSFAISPDGLLGQCREQREWQGCRSTMGVTRGKFYYEATCKDEGLNRVGWATMNADLNLGTDKEGYGFGGTGKKSNNRQFDSYGEQFTMHDVIGCYIDMDGGKIKYSKNGVDLGHAFDIPGYQRNKPMFAACVLKNSEIEFNFGGTPFKYPPSDYVGLSGADESSSVPSSKFIHQKQSTKRANNAPYAVIIEPSRELAEQTARIIAELKKHVNNPTLSEVLVVGGVPAAEQLTQIQRGVDIVIGTPGRVDDFISTGKIDLGHVRFLVLDECDGLLTAGCGGFIKRMHSQIPKVAADGKRLQVVVCSATLHIYEVKKLANEIMNFPIWVDLKGEDAVPETVHHVVVPVDPIKDPSWMGLRTHIQTDGVHSKDRVDSRAKETKEKWSEGVKILKGEYCVRAIREHKMEQAIIFCRTKLDCDNLEKYFRQLSDELLTCVCLHSDRKPAERRGNLEKFKNREVRHLICTDVAARGIDIRGVPFVINVTLPDDKQNYVHRIGRVGRAERMGNCNNRGRGCYNTNLTDFGGCCIWYDENTILGEIEGHLKITIEQTTPMMKIPVDEFDGKVVYGVKKSKSSGSKYKDHADVLAPRVAELQSLETSVQTSFLQMKVNIAKIL